MDLKKQYVHTRNWVKATSKAAVFETKRSALLLAFGFVCTIADAQNYGVGQAAISDAAQGIAKYQDSVQKLVYAIAAVVGIVGAFSVYFKMQNGDQDVKKSVMMTVGGCIALIALASAIPAFFK